jgi:predicted CoA-binding protein
MALPSSDEIATLLGRARTIAVVGLSDNPLRPSYGVSRYLQSRGYRIIPVNPHLKRVLGEKAYPSLVEVPGNVDIANIFRRSEYVEEIVLQAMARKIPLVWMQEGVVDDRAAERARQAGILVVMDECILKRHQALFPGPWRLSPPDVEPRRS